MKHFLYYVLLGFCCCVEANNSGSWVLTGGIKDLFETPLGKVYKIDQSQKYFISSQKLRKNQKGNYKPQMGGLLQFSFLRDNKSSKRYVAIDFMYRAFPAFSSESSPHINCCLTRSDQSEIKNDYSFLNGLIEFSNKDLYLFSSYYVRKYYAWIMQQEQPYIKPAFEPISMRVIFDTQTEEVITFTNEQRVVISDKRNMGKWPEEDYRLVINNYGGDEVNVSRVNARNIGVITIERPNYRNQYLEISEPLVRQFDNQDEWETLAPLSLSSYPYKQYLRMNKKTFRNVDELLKIAKRDKNPDFQYAVALELLYGEEGYCDPVNAITLLEKAAKDYHVLALYQLGVCYSRGYGVKPDIEKALKYLRKSAGFKYQNAVAMEWFLRWDMAFRPKFNTEEFNNLFKSIDEEYPNKEHDLGLIAMNNNRYGELTPQISLKYAANLEAYCGSGSLIRQDTLRKPQYFVDYAIEAGYYPALSGKARWNKQLDIDERIKLYQQAIKAGDFRAIPDLYLLLAQQNRLSANDFNANYDIMFADNILYQLLAFVVRNPGFPGIHDFLNNNFEEATKKIFATNLPDKDLFLGLIKLYQRKKLDSIRDGFFHLSAAAKQRNPIAQYLVASYLYRNDIPVGMQRALNMTPRVLLSSSCQSGYLPADILLAKLEIASGTTKNAISLLGRTCSLNYPLAYYLYGTALTKQRDLKGAMVAFLKAAELGDYHSYRELALLSSNSSPNVARKYWRQYILADLEYRKYDPCDPYFPNVYDELYKWKRIFLSNVRKDTKWHILIKKQGGEIHDEINNYIKNR